MHRTSRHRRTLLRFTLVSCALGTTILWAGCVSSPAAPTSAASFSQVDLQTGIGAAAATGNSLTVSYTGWLYNSTQANDKGAVFDTSGATPFTFTLGSASVIGGWNQGIVGMRPGGIRQLIIPPSLAYGEVRHGDIPPNATLVFEVELISIGTS